MAVPQLVEMLDNFYSTTWQLMRKEAVDNIFKATPFWFWLTDKKRRRTESGGRWIGIQVMYGKNTSVKAFGRGDTFEAPDDEIITTAYYPWKYVAASVKRFFVDDTKNRGKAQIIDLANSKLENAKLSLIDRMEADAFGDGTQDDGKAIHGLEHLLRDSEPTAAGEDVVGGIDSYAHPWWRPTVRQWSGDLIANMRHLYNSCSNGNDTPDLILGNQVTFELYEDMLFDTSRIVDKKYGDAGFENLTFKGKPFVWSPSAPADKLYMLNSRYLEWVADDAVNFEMTEWKYAQESLDRVAQILVSGNIVTSQRRRQGVLTGISL